MPKIVFVGGGTGLASTLRILKTEPWDLTAIVCSTDNGGYSGWQREAFAKMGLGLPALGDFRQVATVLANDEKEAAYFNTRCPKDSCFGNMLLADIWRKNSLSLSRGWPEICERLKINERHKVLLASELGADICARFPDGKVVKGEWPIIDHDKPAEIKELFLEPAVTASQEVLAAIQDADFLIVGPGSLRTSLVSALLVGGVKEAIASSKAPLIFIVNLLSQQGQTTGWSAVEHVQEINRYAGQPIDIAVVNTEPIPEYIFKYYRAEAETKGDYLPHAIELGPVEQLEGIQIIRDDFIPSHEQFVEALGSRIRWGDVRRSKHHLVHASERLGNIIGTIIGLSMKKG